VGTSEALDLVVLADATIVRSIANYTLGYARLGAKDDAQESDGMFDLDSLFDDAEDSSGDVSNGLTLEAVEASMADTSERDTLVLTDDAAWSFVLLRAGSGGRQSLIREARALASDMALDLRVLSWQAAAGSSAQALFAVPPAFYVGLGFVALGAVLVIMNALVISVLERSGEIGTMRSLGARSGFIRRLFVAESLLLTMSAAMVGVVLGLFLSWALADAGMTIDNPLLVSLFGGESIRPVATGGSVLYHLGLAALVGALAWVYPVSLAMRIQPVTAMNGN
ncbi:MAG: FtsX-like permease family protein, partial [Spirochaetales bacterium]|nr:FtsX-like permease family protein [Spirochaetales bacterium]